MNNKIHWLDIAELLDSYRVYPRLLVAAHCWFVYRVSFFILHWYAAEPAVARGAEETAMVGVVFTAIATLSGYVFKVYSDSGRAWGPPPDPQSPQEPKT